MTKLSESIKKEFKTGDVVNVDELYEKFVDSQDLDVIIRIKHNIRSVLNQLRTRNEIVNVGYGLWKSTKSIETPE